MTELRPTSTRRDWLILWGKRLLVIPPILLAVGLLIYLTQSRAAPSKRSEVEVARILSVIAVSKFDVKPQVVGFGTAQYARKWRAVSQVAGRTVKIHPDLRPGAVISSGVVILKIDDADYRSTVAELEASIDEMKAGITQLEQTSTHYEKALALEMQALTVFEGELKRARALVARDVASLDSIDGPRRAVISQQRVVLDLKNNNGLIKPKIQALRAGIRRLKAQREQAVRNTERTEIRTPFTMRIGDVKIEADQYLAANEVLFEGSSFADIEIEVQLSRSAIARLLAPPPASKPPPGELSMRTMRLRFPVSPKVEISGGESGAFYEGRFLRVRELVNSKTRQAAFVIGVTNERQLSGGRPRPPVLEGSLCKVTLQGQSIGERIVLPRRALHGSLVYVVDKASRLEKRGVKVEFTQDELVVIASGLQAGDRVIVSDPSPAVEGMLVQPLNDENALNYVKKAMQGNE